MKLFVATDVHGSAYWAKRIVEEFKRSKSDVLILLGDVYNHGPRNPFPRDYAPMKVAETFNGIADKVVAVKGNCDSEVDEMISEFPFVPQVIVPCNGRRLYFTHGHVYNKDNLPTLSHGDILFYGHFHRNEIVEANGVICVNVSSASLPKDRAAYCIVEDDGVTLCALDETDSEGAKLLGFSTSKL
ncbi:MAG: phosphodiesterase [Clostridiales bacterium]|nr:phosphodiesterase [Clostridiales bacterium]